jgi:imidazole glycerol-phosphate synthase subunit HisH
MQRVAIIDTGLCNLDSIRRALEECGAKTVVTDDPGDLHAVDRIVLPGVGAFPDAMTRLRERGLDDALRQEVLVDGAPLLGVCLGMQLLADRGEESGGAAGLGFVRGTVRRLVPSDAERVPHMGWNEVHDRRDPRLLAGIADDADFYFVHSFHLVCDDPSDVAATTPYCGGFTSVVERDNIFGVQFHPEKSQRHGFELLQRFLAA